MSHSVRTSCGLEYEASTFTGPGTLPLEPRLETEILEPRRPSTPKRTYRHQLGCAAMDDFDLVNEPSTAQAGMCWGMLLGLVRAPASQSPRCLLSRQHMVSTQTSKRIFQRSLLLYLQARWIWKGHADLQERSRVRLVEFSKKHAALKRP